MADMATVGVVYTVHLDEPLAGNKRHYTGWTSNLPNRLFDHKHNGSASAGLLRLARKRGVTWQLAMTVEPATTIDEKVIKRIVRDGCPLCGVDPTDALRAAGVTGTIDRSPSVQPATRAQRMRKRG